MKFEMKLMFPERKVNIERSIQNRNKQISDFRFIHFNSAIK